MPLPSRAAIFTFTLPVPVLSESRDILIVSALYALTLATWKRFSLERVTK